LTVSAVSGNTITAKRPDGSTQSITVNSSTVYTIAGTAAQLSDIKSGLQIHATGTLSNGTLTATHIDAVLPHLGGKLTAISGSTLTVTDRAGTARKIVVSAGTTYQRSGAAISLSDLQVGNQIDAAGSLNERRQPGGAGRPRHLAGGRWRGHRRQRFHDHRPGART